MDEITKNYLNKQLNGFIMEVAVNLGKVQHEVIMGIHLSNYIYRRR